MSTKTELNADEKAFECTRKLAEEKCNRETQDTKQAFLEASLFLQEARDAFLPLDKLFHILSHTIVKGTLAIKNSKGEVEELETDREKTLLLFFTLMHRLTDENLPTFSLFPETEKQYHSSFKELQNTLDKAEAKRLEDIQRNYLQLLSLINEIG